MRYSTILFGAVAAIIVTLSHAADAQVFRRAKPTITCGTDGECSAVFPNDSAPAQRLCGNATAGVAWHKGDDDYLISCRTASVSTDDVSYLVSAEGRTMVALDYGKFLPKRLIPPAAVAGPATVTNANASEVAATGAPVPVSSTVQNTDEPLKIATDAGEMLLCAPVDGAKATDSNFIMMQRTVRSPGVADCFTATYIHLTGSDVQIGLEKGDVQAGDPAYFGPAVTAAARRDIRAMTLLLRTR